MSMAHHFCITTQGKLMRGAYFLVDLTELRVQLVLITVPKGGEGRPLSC